MYKNSYKYRFTWFTTFCGCKIGTRNVMYINHGILHFTWNVDRGTIEPKLYKNHKLVARGATYTGVTND